VEAERMMYSPGDLIGNKYRVVRLIGDGGMGSVYEARHEVLGTDVALKFLHAELAERPGLASRFLQEARVAAQIKSPHVAHVSDVDTTAEGLPYLVMDLLGGESLQRLLDRELKLRPEQAIDFALQILSGLEAAHAIRVVHRDLKPDNVFVTPTPSGPLLKLIDFGIAKLREGAGGRGLTRAGVVMGTPEYMPPEQLYTASDVDERADIYALGVIMFEMLSGKRPADGPDAETIVGQVLGGRVLRLGALEPALPATLVAIVERALSGDRDLRFRTAGEMRTALLDARIELGMAARTGQQPARATGYVKGSTEDDEPIPDNSAIARGSTELGAPPMFGAPVPAWPTGGTPIAAARPKPRRSAGALLALLFGIALFAGGGVLLWSLQPKPRAIPPLASPASLPVPDSTGSSEFGPLATAAETPAPTPIPTAVTPTPAPGQPTPTPTPTSTTAPTPSPDGGLLPFPVPSTFPPLPSTFPALPPLPSVLPSGFPGTFPGIPGFGPAPTPTSEPTTAPPPKPTKPPPPKPRAGGG
jgi:eukaryotic-like serine/threonine-protein kinase